jgi:hypothetical protein
VSLSAHCYPQSANWLAALVAPLRGDRSIVASYGRQWADPASNPFEALDNHSLFPATEGLPQVVAFSNANSAIRRQYLLEHPFSPAIGILEDHLFWRELGDHAQVAYVPAALVHHEHTHFSWRYYWRRWLREGHAWYFLSRHRCLSSPFVHEPILTCSNFFYVYPRLAGSFAKRKHMRAALLAVPFFWMRDLVILAGFIRARRSRQALALQDELSHPKPQAGVLPNSRPDADVGLQA